MAADEEEYEEEFEEYDEYEDDEEEDEDEEGGLSGLVVLLMGVVMLGAFASVVWIAYQQGTKSSSETPYVAADPDPVKIETAEEAAAENEREVYDSIDGGDTNPVETIVAGPEEPVDRTSDDTIADIAAAVDGAVDDAAEITDDAVADRIAQLEATDQALNDLSTDSVDSAADAVDDAVEEITVPEPANFEPEPEPEVSVPEPVAVTGGDALSGSHLVQVGAFRSQAEADTFWSSMSSKVGGYLDGKSKDVERADLGARGIYYRLRVGPFASADAAKTYCEGLKSRGQDCLIKAK